MVTDNVEELSAVERVTEKVASDLITNAKARDWFIVEIDWTRIHPDMRGIFKTFSEELRSPYGVVSNWDAFGDLVCDLTHIAAAGYLIVLRGIAKTENVDIAQLYDSLQWASDVNAKFNTRLRTLIVTVGQN